MSSLKKKDSEALAASILITCCFRRNFQINREYLDVPSLPSEECFAIAIIFQRVESMANDLKILIAQALSENKSIDTKEQLHKLSQKLDSLNLKISLNVDQLVEAVLAINNAKKILANYIKQNYSNLSGVAENLSIQLLFSPMFTDNNTLNFEFHKALLQLLNETAVKEGVSDLPSKLTVPPPPVSVGEVVTNNKLDPVKYFESVWKWIEIIMIVYTLYYNHQSNQQMNRIEEKIDQLLKSRSVIEQVYEYPDNNNQPQININNLNASGGERS